MLKRESGGLEWFEYGMLAQLGEIVTHGVFTRRGGVSKAPFDTLNAGPTVPDEPAARTENYRRIAEALPGRPLLVGTTPLQGTNVIEVDSDLVDGAAHPAILLPQGGDAFVTRMPGIGVFWAVADCTAIMLVDPRHRAIGLVHAGWRGTSASIAGKVIRMMGEAYGTQPADLYAAVGPSIGPCCYEVDEHVRAAFAAYPLAHATGVFSTVTVADGAGGERESLRVDLAASNRAQLRALGVSDDHIETSDFCTGHRRDLFYSHRMEGGRTGRFAVVLALV